MKAQGIAIANQKDGTDKSTTYANPGEGILHHLEDADLIPVGYVGVACSLNGGVQGELLTQGFHLAAPTKKVKKFTVGDEQLVLTKDERDGSEGDDSLMW